MASFFEKLKKGMGDEATKESSSFDVPADKITEEEITEIKAEKNEPKKIKDKSARRIKKIEIAAKEARPETKKSSAPEVSARTSIYNKIMVEKTQKEKESKENKWLEPEGQLAIDAYQTETEMVLQSAIAGVKSEDLDILIEGDVLTIQGERKKPIEEEGEYFSQECYWGRFSRQLILPVEIDPNRIEATLKEGILIVRMPKLLKERKRKIIVGN